MVESKVIALGGVDYEVRPMPGVLQAWDVVRGDEHVGGFLLNEHAQLEVVPPESELDDARRDLLLRIGEEYVGPNYRRST